ncbi:DUF262 domain-containing protein [Rhizobium sp. 007]|nr:DUF262 domain-containing protein [Rhizobium sp. 007]
MLTLFDSLMKGYPISSFLFWNVAPENELHWQIYKFSENFRYGEVHNENADVSGGKLTLILDGQQRLTSLLIGLRGSFTVKAKLSAGIVQTPGRRRSSISTFLSIRLRFPRTRRARTT